MSHDLFPANTIDFVGLCTGILHSLSCFFLRFCLGCLLLLGHGYAYYN